MRSLNDTIAAIATAPGEGAIGIVRVSGKAALKIADKVFKSKDGKKALSFKTHTVHYGWIAGGLDEALFTVMRAPRSFTREDVVEISCHGSIVALREVLDLVLSCGARLAEPGEFTKRAFLNGRIDLAQAEAVIDVIRAKTDSALKLGSQQLRGYLSERINGLRNILLGALVVLEANIDFPEEEIKPADLKTIRQRLDKADGELNDLLDKSSRARILREGVHAVICGKPNVGKSSLLNAFLKQERSIVTPVAGTTRDTIEEMIDIKGVPVRITDTAGIIRPSGLVEEKAIKRSKRYIDAADIVIILFDGSRKLDSFDFGLIAKLKGRHVIAAINKTDLKQKIEKGLLEAEFKKVIPISAKKLKNINLLEAAVIDFVYGGKIHAPEYAAISRMRHIEAIKNARKFLKSAQSGLDAGLGIELISQDTKDAVGYLDDILGKRFSKELLDKIFSEFCVGK